MKIACIIMDWAGTAVDYGSFAPIEAFINTFAGAGLAVTPAQVRRPMGMAKIDHTRALLQMPEVAAKFFHKNGRRYTEDDVRRLYAAFEARLFDTLASHTTPISGVRHTVELLRQSGVKIGSTTGYTRAMMDVVEPAAAAKGYAPDCVVTPDGLPAGRPAPYMIYANMTRLAIDAAAKVVKVGDTIADIAEGRHAGVWTVGVITGSNCLALSESEVADMDADELCRRKQAVRQRMTDAGAHFVIDHIAELPAVVESLNEQLAARNF